MDIAASLWPTAVDVDLGDWSYEIPELPASEWIAAIASPLGGAIVPGLLDPRDQRLIWRDLATGRLHPDVINDAWRAVVGVACGRPWWQASRLVLSATAPDNWPVIHGKLVQRGFDFERASIGGFCNIVQVMALEACKDQSERAQFEFELTMAPPEVSAEEAYASVDASGDFLAAMQQFQNLGGRARPDEGGPAREVR